MPQAIEPSNGFFSRMMGKKKPKSRTEDIKLPNRGKIDPRLERFKERKGIMQPTGKMGETMDKAHEGMQGFQSLVKKIRDKKK